jgi:hypothetical protein
MGLLGPGHRAFLRHGEGDGSQLRGSPIIVRVLVSYVGHIYSKECPTREEPKP